MNPIHITTNKEEFSLLREQWTRLNDASNKGTIFSSWEWLFTWWEIYHNVGHRQLYILSCHDDNNELIGIAPFQIINDPKQYFPCNRQILFLGTGETDGSSIFGEYVDLIIKDGQQEHVISLISDYLYSHQSQWDGLKFQQLLAGSYLSQLFKLHANKISKKTTPYGVRTVIDLPKTYQEYLMTLRKKKRNNITRVWTRLKSEQDFSLQRYDKAENVHASLDIVATLNKSRRDALQKESAFEYDNFNRFHHQLIDYLEPLNKVWIHILKFNEEPVAALYSFVDNNMLHVYQCGYKNEYGQHYSLMTTMLSQAIKASIEDNDISHYNFMFSENEATYKTKYSSKTETMYDISFEKNTLKSKLYHLLHGPVKTIIKRLLLR